MAVLFGLTGYVFSTLPPYKGVISEMIRKRSFRSELEGMRGLLAFSVVIHHAVVWYMLLFFYTPAITGPNANFYEQLGTGSVTMFFFITGFLFWSKLMAQPQQDFKIFLSARMRRLGPAYMGAALVLFSLVGFLTHYQLHSAPGTLVLDSIRILWADTPRLNGLATTPWLWGVTWTLRFECLFYLIIPFLGWFAGTVRKSLSFVAACGVLWQLNHLARANNFMPPGFLLYEGFVRHLFLTFSIGIVTAHLIKVPRLRKLGQSGWAAVLAVVLIGVNWYFVPAKYGAAESFSLAFPFFVVACGCGFWGLLRSRAVLFLGQISYSVYLIHPLIFGAVLIPLSRMKNPPLQTPQGYWAILLMMAPAVVGVATLWHRLFELPFLMRNKKAVFVSADAAQVHIHA